MNPETLLTRLVQAYRQLPIAPITPFVLQKAHRALPSLSYPVFPEGSFSVDADMQNALQMLVQWGYLLQSEQAQSTDFLLTPAGLNYAARLDGTWDGSERRRDDRRSTGRALLGANQRRVERRLGTTLA
jgi:hypothetical protein